MVILLTGTIDRVMSVLVAVVRAFDILRIGMLVADDHHVGDSLGVALEHLPQ